MAFRPSIARGLALSCILTCVVSYITLGIFVNGGNQPQHSIGIMQLAGEWGEYNTFAVCFSF